MTDEADLLIDVDVTAQDNVAVQCEHATESVDDFSQNVRVLNE